MKIHYNRFYLLILCIAILLCGCSNLDGTEIQRCTDAIERLKKLNQMHYISTTLIGESSDSLEISAVSEYWISGNE
jgi:PBP1b-binding outer membrane lipoprotein LpoB